MSRAAEIPRPLRPAALLPEAGRFWIRYVPRAWEPPEQPWVHLAEGRLGEWGRAAAQAAQKAAAGANLSGLLNDEPLDDVLYLPPVPARRAAARDKLASSRLVDGTPVVLQLFPGDESSVPAVSGVAFVYDLLPALLARDLERLGKVPQGAAVAAVWALIPGLTDDPDVWEEGCSRLAAAGVRCVQGVAPELSPSDRRRLAERWSKEKEDEEELFDALFHREPPSERDFARVAARHGLAPFLPRPLPRPPVLRIENRRIGGTLALIAELWLRLGRSEEQGQAFFRSARWIDATHHDVEAVADEGNLAVLPLDLASRDAVGEMVETGEAALLPELLAEYLEDKTLEDETSEAETLEAEADV